MNTGSEVRGPVVIGGVGGSGTRVVAQIISTFGFYIGSDLNGSCDNLLYTLLFKRPKWFYRNCQNRSEMNIGINLFQKCMLRQRWPSVREWLFLIRAVGSVALLGRSSRSRNSRLWPATRIRRLLFKKGYVRSQYLGWGWKEPNTHLLVEYLAEHFPDLKYIHTMRHGLDMALSKNQEQLYNWGPLYGVEIPRSPSEEARASLKYWIRVHQKILQIGQHMGDDRFLSVNFDELCRSPERGIRRLITFLGIEVDKEAYQEAVRLPKMPSSVGRYRSHDIRQFDKEDLCMLPQFGFSIE